MLNKLIFTMGLCLFIIGSTLSQSRLEANTYLSSLHTTENLGDTYPHLLRARISMQTLDYENALLHADNAIAQNPGSAEAYLVRAEIKRKFGMESDAALDFSIANRLNPYAANIFGYNGKTGIVNTIYFQPKEFLVELSIEHNMDYYEKYMEALETKNDDLLVILGLIKYGEFSDALDQLDLLPPSKDDHISAVIYDLKGSLLMEQGLYEEASKELEIATALYPKLPLPWYNLGRLALSKENYDEAKEFFNKAIEMNDNFVKAYFQLALLFKQEGKNLEAIKVYDKIINKNNDYLIEAYVNRGLAFKSVGNYTKAFNDLDIAISMSPDNPYLYKNRGNLFLLFGATEKAILDFNKAIELDNSFSEAHFNRAISRIILLDYAEACEDLESSIDLGYEKGIDFLSFFCID